MKERNAFLGNEICCGTYAFLNTVQDREIDHKIYEITSSVPFGIRHRKERDYSRLLTTYCDPNIGLDRAAGLWGYRQHKELFRNSKAAAEYILDKSRTDRCLVGPLDMGRLGYLVLPNLYRNMDHYITIFQEDKTLFCIDSEGIPIRRTNGEELESWLLMAELPEAEGWISVRSYKRAEFLSGNEREKGAIRDSVELIVKNLTEARESGQGNYAIEKCWQWLKEQPVARWRLSFLYDIAYLSQRKILQQYWCRLVNEMHLLRENLVQEAERIMGAQIHILANMFYDLKWKNMVYERDFQKMAHLEEKLSIVVEDFGEAGIKDRM